LRYVRCKARASPERSSAGDGVPLFALRSSRRDMPATAALADRALGLLHLTSLPSRYGIGDVGPAACAWIDFWRRLAAVVAILPLTPLALGTALFFLLRHGSHTLIVSPTG